MNDMKKVVLKAKRDFSVRRHHPWIFSGAIASDCGDADGAVPPGGTVEVCAADGETLGYGSYSPASQIRVRMLSFDPKRVPDAAFVAGLVEKSVARRADFLLRGETNAVRLVNAESDGLPGVVADCYGGWIVCQLTSAGAEFWKGTIAAALMTCVPNAKGVAERTDVEVRAKEGLPVATDGNRQPLTAFGVLAGEEPPEFVEIFEGPIKYLVDVRRGHKTGFYLDQRDARAAVGALAKDRDVLNCFCYTGGFGLAAAAGGARSVTQVDISSDALELARRNAELTSGKSDPSARRSDDSVISWYRRKVGDGRSLDTVPAASSLRGAPRLVAPSGGFAGGYGKRDGCYHATQRDAAGTVFADIGHLLPHNFATLPISYVEADVFQYLRKCRDAGKSFDLIVLDPPKFASVKSQVMKAARGYKDINLLAMKLLRPGGVLATFSCSGAMTPELFDKVLAEAAQDAGRDFQMIGRTRQGADHPVGLNFPEGLYLKGVLLRSCS